MGWFLLSLGSAVCSAAAAILQKRILGGMHALQFSFVVSIIIAALSAIVPLTSAFPSLDPAAMAILTVKSIIGGSAFLFVMMALERSHISYALPLLGLTPGCTALVSLLVMGEALSGSEWMGVVLMMVGTAILEGVPFRRGQARAAGSLSAGGRGFVLAALACFTLSAVGDKLLVSGYKVDPRIVLFYQHCIYALLFAGMLLIRRTGFRQAWRLPRGTIAAVIVVAVLTVGYRLLQLEATARAPVALVLAVKRTSILFAAFFGGRLFSEERLTMRLIGAAVIIAAGFFILRNVG